MTRLWRLARRPRYRGNHRPGARPAKPADHLIPAEWQTRSSEHVLIGPALSPLEDFFPTVVLPMPQPVSPAPVNPAALHDWAVAG
ncbi:MAG TPA: hypothetical protein VIP77_16000 [Jiangellaceae bacterium]